MHRFFAALVLLAALFVSSVGLAQEAAPPASPEPEETSWYGWQILAADALSAAEVLSTTSLGEGKLASVGISTFLVVGPIIHIGHGRGGMAAASFGMRLGGPALGAVAGFIVGGESAEGCTSSSPDGCDAGWSGLASAVAGGAVGALVGAIAASGLDAGLLAHEKVTPKAPPPVSFGIRRTQGGAAISAAMVW